MFVITGGGSGLGQALAVALSERRQSVLIVGRNEHALRDTAQRSDLIDFFCADVSSDMGRRKLVEQVASYSKILGLIHNAGIIDPILPMSQISEHAWRACMATNVDAPLFLTQALLSHLGQARVLHIGSAAAYFAVKGWGAYGVSKAALAMLTRSWQLDEPERLIASVMPGIIDTAMQASIRHAQNMEPQKQAFFRELKAAGKLLSPSTVATFLSWLLLDTSPDQYVSQEWDIYDKNHHAFWLRSPHQVPEIGA